MISTSSHNHRCRDLVHAQKNASNVQSKPVSYFSREKIEQENMHNSLEFHHPEIGDGFREMYVQPYWDELKAQLKLVVPVSFTFLLRKSVDIVSVVFVGHLSSSQLSAAGLATVTANVSGFSMLIGFAGALSTLCSQAYGSNDLQGLGLVLQKSIVILITFVNIPVTILWLCSRVILESLGQNKSLSVDANVYLCLLIPSLWAFTCSVCLQNWLHSQSKAQAVAFIAGTVALLHPAWCYLYIYKLGLGYRGAAIAVSTSKFLELIFIILYLNFGSTIFADTKFKFSNKCFENWWPFLRIGIPNLLMMSEWWASEAIIFMSGLLVDPDVEVG